MRRSRGALSGPRPPEEDELDEDPDPDEVPADVSSMSNGSSDCFSLCFLRASRAAIFSAISAGFPSSSSSPSVGSEGNGALTYDSFA